MEEKQSLVRLYINGTLIRIVVLTILSRIIMSISQQINNKTTDSKPPKDMVKCYLSSVITIRDVETNKVILKKRG